MNFGLNMTEHNFSPFGTFNSDFERESYEEFAPTNNGKTILTLFLHLFTGPVICGLSLSVHGTVHVRNPGTEVRRRVTEIHPGITSTGTYVLRPMSYY